MILKQCIAFLFWTAGVAHATVIGSGYVDLQYYPASPENLRATFDFPVDGLEVAGSDFFDGGRVDATCVVRYESCTTFDTSSYFYPYLDYNPASYSLSGLFRFAGPTFAFPTAFGDQQNVFAFTMTGTLEVAPASDPNNIYDNPKPCIFCGGSVTGAGTGVETISHYKEFGNYEVYQVDSIFFTFAPEPNTLILVGFAIGLLGWRARKPFRGMQGAIGRT